MPGPIISFWLGGRRLLVFAGAIFLEILVKSMVLSVETGFVEPSLCALLTNLCALLKERKNAEQKRFNIN
jgi:hypothetical protein